MKTLFGLFLLQTTIYVYVCVCVCAKPSLSETVPTQRNYFQNDLPSFISCILEWIQDGYFIRKYNLERDRITELLKSPAK